MSEKKPFSEPTFIHQLIAIQLNALISGDQMRSLSAQPRPFSLAASWPPAISPVHRGLESRHHEWFGEGVNRAGKEWVAVMMREE